MSTQANLWRGLNTLASALEGPGKWLLLLLGEVLVQKLLVLTKRLLLKAEILLLQAKVLLLQAEVLLLNQALLEAQVLTDDGLLLIGEILLLYQGKVVLRSEAARPSLVTLSLRQHSPLKKKLEERHKRGGKVTNLLVLGGLLVETVSFVDVVILGTNGGNVSGLRASAEAHGLLPVLLSLPHVTSSLPVQGLLFIMLSFPIGREPHVSVGWMRSSVGQWEIQTLVYILVAKKRRRMEGEGVRCRKIT